METVRDPDIKYAIMTHVKVSARAKAVAEVVGRLLVAKYNEMIDLAGQEDEVLDP